ncbi:Tcp11-domain-containing protein [Acrodontium crateriforme]|uniref:Tcp11-domain-containing protein n=1 Tax=Acrodontium crateriforme TaxID=150365 RepID=A0AAQ3M5X5_9PEZI|nr:Tcp11-domain-containing protein [Acrodontium crateriforme]
MDSSSRQHINRRDSITCSPPNPTHAYRDSVFSGANDPVASRELPTQTVTDDNRSQEHETFVRDNTSQCDTASRSSSLPPLSPSSSDEDIMYDIYQYIIELMEPNGIDTSVCFEQASLQPPITIESLAELDIPRIINNPKLRHDVNFDRELHFRPNLDGSRGRQKLKSADHYWKALEGELFMYGFASKQRQSVTDADVDAYWVRILKASQLRLRKIFEAIRDILRTLVPDYEQKVIIERLDVDLIMQEISNGMCDLIALSTWLAKVLQAHCAPMRDELVEQMKTDIQNGAMESNHEMLVKGLRQLLAILEFMKLDVANHQIRHMRPLLIEDTVNFQRRYNTHRIANNKIDVRGSRCWLVNEMEHLRTPSYSPTHLYALNSALLRDLFSGEHHSSQLPFYPATFYLDADRLRSMRTELHSRIYQQICKDIFIDFVPQWVNKNEVLKAQTALHISVAALAGANGRFCERLENIAVEIVRIVLMLEGRQHHFDSDLLTNVECRLRQELSSYSPVFERHARDLCAKLLPKLSANVDKHIRLNALALQESLIPSAPANSQVSPLGFGAVCAPPSQNRPFDADEDILRRLTHVVVLHWHVWADLVYLAPNMDDSDYNGEDRSSVHSQSVSPTMPVAQAIFNGRKFLPTAITVTDIELGMPTPAASPISAMDHDQETDEQDEAASIDHQLS